MRARLWKPAARRLAALQASLRAALVALLLPLGLVAAGPAAAAPAASGPSLIVSFETSPANHAEFRARWLAEETARLEPLKREGTLRSYHLFFNRYLDSGAGDAVAVLRFSGEAGLQRWNALERSSPGGLSAPTLGLVTAVRTTPAELVRNGAAAGADAAAPAFLVIPYDIQVPVPEYLKYLDAYTIPQFEGWVQEGVLAGYEIYLPRYPAARAWTSLLILKYRSDQALARRDEVVQKVRARLASDPRWKAVSDNKKNVRTEKVLMVADDLAPGGGR